MWLELAVKLLFLWLASAACPLFAAADVFRPCLEPWNWSHRAVAEMSWSRWWCFNGVRLGVSIMQWTGCREMLLPITRGSPWCTSCWWQFDAGGTSGTAGGHWGLAGESQGCDIGAMQDKKPPVVGWGNPGQYGLTWTSVEAAGQQDGCYEAACWASHPQPARPPEVIVDSQEYIVWHQHGPLHVDIHCIPHGAHQAQDAYEE